MEKAEDQLMKPYLSSRRLLSGHDSYAASFSYETRLYLFLIIARPGRTCLPP